ISEEGVKRFAREAKLASQLDEPHCVTIHDSGRDTDLSALYLVMEYLEGRSLKAMLRAEGRLEIKRALEIADQPLRGLAAAHRRGIVHRDVKPENIFLIARDERREFVKLLDFGIAKQLPKEAPLTAITRAGFMVGTPEYIAPEQALGKPVDGRADLYA